MEPAIPDLALHFMDNPILNVKSPHYEWPNENSLIYVIQVSRLHILERSDYGDNFRGLAVRMCCGLRLINIRPQLMTLQRWEDAVEWTREHEVSILRRQGNVCPACLDCDRNFNQSEIAC
jgi:hypothetical protein